MKKGNEDPDNLGGLGGMLPAEVLKMLNGLLEQMHRAGHINQGSKIEVVYVASGGQHVETQINVGAYPIPGAQEALAGDVCGGAGGTGLPHGSIRRW